MFGNIVWNLIFLLDIGGVIGLIMVACERWPTLIKRLEPLCCSAGGCFVLILLSSFVITHVLGYPRVNGRYNGGVHYGDD